MRTMEAEPIIEAVKHLVMEANFRLPEDVKAALRNALRAETSPLGRYSLEKVTENFELADRCDMPICQDTGIAVLSVEIGEEVYVRGLGEALQEGVRRGCREGYLRSSIVDDPVFDRKNTGDNTPAVIHTAIVPGDKLRITVLPKGAGTENMSALRLLNPAAGAAGVKAAVVEAVRAAGGNPCPPIIVGVGIGGTADAALWLAKEALLRDVGTVHLDPRYAALEREILEEVNRLNIGPQGFGGVTTALAVHIGYAPAHIAMLPVGICLNCHVARHKTCVL